MQLLIAKVPGVLRRRNYRSKQGSSIALSAVAALIIVIVGLAMYLLARISGGAREVQIAVDAGDLNVAKQAIKNPGIPIGDLGGSTYIVEGCLRDNPADDADPRLNLDLTSFNNVVGMGLLIQMNAEADGSDAARADANNLWRLIEGTKNSLGCRLQQRLAAKDWAETDYYGIPNAVRMLGLTQGNPQYNSADFQVAYLHQDDNAPANLDLSAFDNENGLHKSDAAPYTYESFGGQSLQPLTLPHDLFSRQSVNGKNVSYLSGYHGISIGSSPAGYYAVPNGPNKQPHKESLTTLGKGKDAPGNNQVFIPPNAFKIGATAQVKNLDGRRLGNVDLTAIAMVGLAPTFQPSIRNGFIIIDNGGNPVHVLNQATPANTNTYAAKQAAVGVQVDAKTGFFSMAVDPKTGYSLISEWEAYCPQDAAGNKISSADLAKALAANPTTAPTTPPPPLTDGRGGQMYDRDGNPITSIIQALQMAGQSQTVADAPTITCTDTNSSEGGCQPCIHLGNPSPPVPSVPVSPADVAFNDYPPGPYNGGNSNTATTELTAAEMTQAETSNLFNQGGAYRGDRQADDFTFYTTGMQYYSNGLPSYTNQYPWGDPTKTVAWDPLANNKHGEWENVNSRELNDQAYVYSDPVAVIGDPDNVHGEYHGGFNSNITYGKPAFKVTIAGSIRQYLNQYFEVVSPGITSKTVAFLQQRMREIDPGVTDQQLNQILDQKLALRKYYIYYNHKVHHLVIDTNGPTFLSSLSKTEQEPDGRLIISATRVSSDQWDQPNNVFLGVTNPFGAAGIHDQLFRTWGQGPSDCTSFSGSVVASDSVYITEGSGAPAGALGSIVFNESTKANGMGTIHFCNPN